MDKAWARAKLAELKELQDEGLIDFEDFEREKRAVLAAFVRPPSTPDQLKSDVANGDILAPSSVLNTVTETISTISNRVPVIMPSTEDSNQIESLPLTQLHSHEPSPTTTSEVEPTRVQMFTNVPSRVIPFACDDQPLVNRKNRDDVVDQTIDDDGFLAKTELPSESIINSVTDDEDNNSDQSEDECWQKVKTSDDQLVDMYSSNNQGARDNEQMKASDEVLTNHQVVMPHMAVEELTSILSASANWSDQLRALPFYHPHHELQVETIQSVTTLLDNDLDLFIDQLIEDPSILTSVLHYCCISNHMSASLELCIRVLSVATANSPSDLDRVLLTFPTTKIFSSIRSELPPTALAYDRLIFAEALLWSLARPDCSNSVRVALLEAIRPLFAAAVLHDSVAGPLFLTARDGQSVFHALRTVCDLGSSETTDAVVGVLSLASELDMMVRSKLLQVCKVSLFIIIYVLLLSIAFNLDCAVLCARAFVCVSVCLSVQASRCLDQSGGCSMPLQHHYWFSQLLFTSFITFRSVNNSRIQCWNLRPKPTKLHCACSY
jgi:hypothetical protein